MTFRTARRGAGPAAILLALAVAAVSAPTPAQQQEPEPATTFRWSAEVPGMGTLVIDLAPGWDPESTHESEAIADWRATTRSRCEMSVHVVASPLPDPGFNGPAALLEFVRRQAEVLLPDAIEARYTLRPLRGSDAGGYYFTLRERAPRHPKQAYITQGAIGLANLRAEFTLRSPAPDLDDIDKALKSLAAARLDQPAAPGGTP
jgi:hypothetical protein